MSPYQTSNRKREGKVKMLAANIWAEKPNSIFLTNSNRLYDSNLKSNFEIQRLFSVSVASTIMVEATSGVK